MEIRSEFSLGGDKDLPFAQAVLDFISCTCDSSFFFSPDAWPFLSTTTCNFTRWGSDLLSRKPPQLFVQGYATEHSLVCLVGPVAGWAWDVSPPHCAPLESWKGLTLWCCVPSAWCFAYGMSSIVFTKQMRVSAGSTCRSNAKNTLKALPQKKKIITFVREADMFSII